jgi:hypothetical protein
VWLFAAVKPSGIAGASVLFLTSMSTESNAGEKNGLVCVCEREREREQGGEMTFAKDVQLCIMGV